MVIDPDRDAPGQHPAARSPAGWQRWSELAVALAVIGLGIVVLVETQDIRIARAVARVSPRAIPQIVGTGLVLLGIWYVIDIIRAPHIPSGGEDAEDVDPERPTDWKVLAIMAVGLGLFAVLIREAGFVIASAALFTVSAIAMGNRRVLPDLAIGLVLGTAIFLVFDTWLGVRLPAGWLEGVLP